MKPATTVLFAVLILASRVASPCSCYVPLDDADKVLEIANSSLFVLLGRVEEVTHRTWLENYEEKSELFATVTVVEMFKGPDQVDSVDLETEMSSCIAPFQPGVTFLFFVSRSEGGRFGRTSLCSSVTVDWDDASRPMHSDRKAKIESALKALREAEL